LAVEIYNSKYQHKRVKIDIHNIVTPKHYKTFIKDNEKFWYGVVERIYDRDGIGSFGVRIDEHKNNCSTGLFYFNFDQLIFDFEEKTITEKKGDNMIKDMVLGKYKIVNVVFESSNGGGRSNFRLYDDGTKYKERDLVVVKTAKHGMSIGRIQQFLDEDSGFEAIAEREIVCKVDTTHFDERTNRVREATKLKAELDKQAKQLQGLALFEMLAQASPDFKQKLDKYKEYIGVETTSEPTENEDK